MKELTDLERAVADLYGARKHNKLSQTDIGNKLNISRSTVQRILARPHVMEYMKQEVLEVGRQHLADFMHVLSKQALEGKRAKWAEVYAKIMGLMDDGSRVQVTQIQSVEKDERSSEEVKQNITELRERLERIRNGS